MKCPKCEVGAVTKIVVKGNEMAGFLCDECGTVWFEDEDINEHTGHDAYVIGTRTDQEFTFIDVLKPTQDTKSIVYPQFR